mgnify:CR=1 FL=1
MFFLFQQRGAESAGVGSRADRREQGGDGRFHGLRVAQATVGARLAGGGSVGATFDARAQLQLLADVLQRLHGEGRIGVEIDAPEQGFPADREDMLELFGNLLGNAFKWARGRVRVVVAPDASGRVLAFSVEDDGPGVPGEVLERLGAAGLRTDEARPGHGLGLAIVSDIVAQYGGSIGFGKGAALGGLRVDVRLPLTD